MTSGEQIVHILKSYVLKSFTIGFGVLLVVIFIWLIRGYQQGAYWNAKRARSKGDLERAVTLFKESIYEDIKVSRKALLALEDMDDLVALEALIDLLDIHEMNKVSHKIRAQMCDVIRRRTADTTADKLPLSPDASQDIRAKQKRQWQAWLAKAKEEYDWVDGRFVSKQESKATIPSQKPPN